MRSLGHERDSRNPVIGGGEDLSNHHEPWINRQWVEEILCGLNVEHEQQVKVDNRIKGSLKATSETAKNDTIASGKKAAFASPRFRLKNLILLNATATIARGQCLKVNPPPSITRIQFQIWVRCFDTSSSHFHSGSSNLRTQCGERDRSHRTV